MDGKDLQQRVDTANRKASIVSSRLCKSLRMTDLHLSCNAGGSLFAPLDNGSYRSRCPARMRARVYRATASMGQARLDTSVRFLGRLRKALDETLNFDRASRRRT
ncbi:MAG: hypothetical protein Q9206_004297 [Seirophora lacunosa]